MVKYLLAIDGLREQTEADIAVLLHLYRPERDQLVVLSIGQWDSANSLVLSDDVILRMKKAILTKTEKLVNSVLGQLNAKGITNATGKVELGDPRQLIVEEALKEHVDTVVLGSRGLTAIERLLINSVSQYVMENAQCSVLVVKYPHADEPAHDDEEVQAEPSSPEERPDALKIVSEFVF